MLCGFISDLKEQFVCRFADINKKLKKFSDFANVFDVDIYDTPEELQMELIELQRVSSNLNFRMSIY